MKTNPKLLFPLGYDDETAALVEMKGYCYCVVVELPCGSKVQVEFYDITTIGQHFKENRAAGKACVAYPGMIIVETVSLENMQEAVNELYKTEFFEKLLSACIPDELPSQAS